MRNSLLAAVALLLLAAAAAADNSPTPVDINKARQGINAIEKLLNVFTSKIFDDEELGGVLDIFSKVLSFVGAFLGFFGNNSESSELRYLRVQFAELHARLDSIGLQLGDVMRLIEWNSVRVQYHGLEQHIVTSSRLFDDLMKSRNDEERGFWRRRFLDHYTRNRQAAYDLYQAVAENEYTIGQNLAKAAVHFTQNHKPKVMSFLLNIQRLVLRGGQMQIAYERLQHSEADAIRMEGVWKQRIDKITRKLKSVNDEIRNAYHRQLQVDARRAVIDYRNLHNREFVGSVYKVVAEKFPWRHWFVLAYQDVGGFNNHAVSHCGSYIQFRAEGNRNVVVASSDRKSTRFSRAHALNVLAGVDGSVRDQHAGNFLDAINARLNNNACNAAALRAAVCWGCNVWYTNTNRVAYRRMTAQRGGSMNTFMFG